MSGFSRRAIALGVIAVAAHAAGLVGQAASPPPADQGPSTLHYKGITITPGGFLAAETVVRQNAIGADINTPFNSTPFAGSSQAALSEFNATARQSRLSMLFEGHPGSTVATGYFEMDFLGTGVTSNANQSNSYVLRFRQAWAQAAFGGGWTLSGGQMWSLLAERKRSTDNRTEAPPLVIDPQYTVGFSWARQYGLRLADKLSDNATFAVSAENPQTIFGGHGFPTNFVLGAAGVGGGLFNNQANYSFNVAPDFIGKLAFDGGFGHLEIFGLVSFFRDRIFPCSAASVATPCATNGTTVPSAAGATNSSATGTGAGVNLRIPLFSKHLDFGLHFFGGSGVGRYGTSGLPDATVDPNGNLKVLQNFQALGTLEWHLKKADVYLYVGDEYAGDQVFTIGAPAKGEGYGSPLFANGACGTETLPTGNYAVGALGSCTGDTKNIVEGSIGFWHRLLKGPSGTLQWGLQYSYLIRYTWPGVGAAAGTTAAPEAMNNMFFTSFRYVLP
ncbi:MAG TPA: hypothetical protein VN848_09200 [Gemmatimonadales bacterium]|nr:hypothetical protein [Gemmatimonadales bacterium]